MSNLQNVGQQALTRLKQKRVDSVNAVMTALLGTGAASAAPTVALEVPKQLVLGAADIALCLVIYKIYFDKELTDGNELVNMLKQAGIVTVVGGVLAYAGVKTVQGLFDELGNFAGPLGWIISGTITASETAVIGLLWTYACDQFYKKKYKL